MQLKTAKIRRVGVWVVGDLSGTNKWKPLRAVRTDGELGMLIGWRFFAQIIEKRRMKNNTKRKKCQIHTFK